MRPGNFLVPLNVTGNRHTRKNFLVSLKVTGNFSWCMVRRIAGLSQLTVSLKFKNPFRNFFPKGSYQF